MRLYIKYMVSLRCKLIVKDELIRLGIKYLTIDLGMVETSEMLSATQHELLRENLLKYGLELLKTRKPY